MSAIIVSISKKQVSKQKASTILWRKLTSFISVILDILNLLLSANGLKVCTSYLTYVSFYCEGKDRQHL